MITAVSCSTMRESDLSTISNGVPARELMFRAGKAVVKCYNDYGKTAIVCGTGNNAGDGYVIALLLKRKGIDVRLFLLEKKYSPDGEHYYNQCVAEGIRTSVYACETLNEYDTIIDCIFGTGYRGEPNGIYKKAIETINESNAFVISVDINSGLNGDCGQGDVYVKSSLTVCIGAFKTGHFLGKAKDAAKKIINVDIGIRIIGKSYGVVEPSDFQEIFKERKRDSHKGVFGTTSIIGGCKSYPGAVKLALLGKAALRAGCGVTRIIIPDSIYNAVSVAVREETICVLPSNIDGNMKFDKEILDNAMNDSRVMAIGIGWGRGENNRTVLEYVIKNYTGKLIIDADGLNVLSENVAVLKEKKCEIVLTPHVKEMSRLCGKSVNEILSAPIATAEEFSLLYGVTVALKGVTTIVTDGKNTLLSDTGSAGMATAGSGDVLTGIMTGILAISNDALLKSVAAATYINGISGQLAADKNTDIGMISGDTIDMIPEAIKYCRIKAKQ